METGALVVIDDQLMERRTAESLLACNEELEKYGLRLTERQAAALARARTSALKECGRIEWNGSAVDRLLLAFCSSPYMDGDSCEDTLRELIGLFYELKNGTWDKISDDDVIAFMKNAFNGRCRGSLELLNDEAFRLSEHIRRGRTIESFKEERDGNA